MKQIKIGTYSNKQRKLQFQTQKVRETRPVESDRRNVAYKPRHKRRFFSKKLITVFVIFLLIGILGFGYLRLQQVNSRVEKFDEGGNKIECNNILNPECWTEAFKPQLKQTDGYTNGLLIGLDTRKNSGSLKNTDSIIFFSFNHKTQKTMLVSIPRDFYADVYHTKINAIYAFTSNKKPDDEFFYLKEYISQVIGMPIHYFGYIRFEGVIEAINTVGGVEVCPADAFTAMYPNPAATPSSKQQWLYYDFIKGCQTLDGEKALVYARFRFIRKGPSYLASDFSRARRQQEIIEAVKDKIVAEDLTIGERAEKYWSLFQNFSDSVYIEDPNFEDLLAGLSFINSADRDPTNVVLDPNFGGLNRLIYASSDPGTGYIIRARDKTYKAIQKELANIWEHPEFYKDQPTLMVRNMTGSKLPDTNIAIKLKNDIAYYTWYNVQDDAKTDKFAGIKIVDYTGGAKAQSIKFLLEYFGLEEVEKEPEKYGITRTKRNEDIAIVVGVAELPTTPTPTPTPE